MLTIQSKKELRKYAKEVRKQSYLTGILADKSREIVLKILNSNDFKQAKNIAIYYPVNYEIDLLTLLNVQGKNFYFPKCVNNELQFVKYDKDFGFIDGFFGEKVPFGEAINPEILDIIYVPALIANDKNYRLGYGKGYYDRFFSKRAQKSKKFIIVANELISNGFVEDEYDYQCTGIISA